MSEPSYASRTKQGWPVVGTWRSDGYYGPVNALVLHEFTDGGTELFVALGYNAESGEWGQGRYFGNDFEAAVEYARDTMLGIVINGVRVHSSKFFFDGCHKFYLVEDEEDIDYMESVGWRRDKDLFPIDRLPAAWDESCPLRFIQTVKLVGIVPQFFDGDPFAELRR